MIYQIEPSLKVKRKSTEKRSKPGAENSARLANKPDNKDTKRKETHKSESGTVSSAKVLLLTYCKPSLKVKRNQQKSTEKRKATGTARGSNTSAEHKDDKKGATVSITSLCLSLPGVNTTTLDEGKT